ncbi:ESF1 homolog [Cylas formicarius]|uniref:ESF1 homolog n=1 Tax=Cylas formicarius TaxID=197179 RepID=UPI002958DD4D|nr:ESF1 homolog [Cylas formicarius]
MADPRFSNIIKDPKFRRIPKGQNKMKIDQRFKSMFTDKNFHSTYSTDKRGRPIKKHSKEDLEKYYNLSSEDSENDQEDIGKYPLTLDQSDSENDKGELNINHKSDKDLSGYVKSKLRDLSVDYARGEGKLCSDSSSDDEESDEDIENIQFDHKWGELDGEADTTEEATSRLAACNLDWDRISAVDLMVLFNSFLPSGGVIHSVAIYPSEFGKKRMIDEEVKGPIELVETKNDGVDESEGSHYHMEKLRQYQLNRLKYYYAIITFDSPSSANKIYTECDRMEYESSSTKIDLRFVPEDMCFDDKAKDICYTLPEKYQPKFFTTTALQQAKVDLTWDETNPERLEFTEKLNSGKIHAFNENDFCNYLAGSSDEEEADEISNEVQEVTDIKTDTKSIIDKYKSLLQGISENELEKKRDFEFEMTWDIGLKEKTDQLTQSRIDNKQEGTPFEKYLEKRKNKIKDKRRQKKNQDNDEDNFDIPSDVDLNDPYFVEEFKKSKISKKKSGKKSAVKEDSNDEEDNKQLQLLVANEEEEDHKHFNFKDIQENNSSSKKEKKKKHKDKQLEDNFNINIDDKRFSALFTSHHYNIDPSDSHFRKTKGMETLIKEKLKRKYNTEYGKSNTKKSKQ